MQQIASRIQENHKRVIQDRSSAQLIFHI